MSEGRTSKILETFDTWIFGAAAHAVSGHTLKHLAAAGSGFVVCLMLARRALARPTVAAEGGGDAAVRWSQ